jgi:hypothetical protein
MKLVLSTLAALVASATIAAAGAPETHLFSGQDLAEGLTMGAPDTATGLTVSTRSGRDDAAVANVYTGVDIADGLVPQAGSVVTIWAQGANADAAAYGNDLR